MEQLQADVKVHVHLHAVTTDVNRQVWSLECVADVARGSAALDPPPPAKKKFSNVPVIGDFNSDITDGGQRGAEVLCRELDCGAPSLLQGALSPLGQTFHCEGHESALMDCPRSNSSTCSSGATVNLTCSEPLRLVGGASRCAGTVEVKHRGEWRRVGPSGLWDQEDTAVVCRDLDCGSAVYGEQRRDFPQSRVWRVSSDCVKKSSVRECVWDSSFSSWGLEVMCSGKSVFVNVQVECVQIEERKHV
ncbi:scavenger receptor cysteine-rich type 1 protein M130-like [Boleophthalmus pectinirostris]|uniref:scavenger receptor cysteine-rich type 1 protein M130-like n=1 Tax=Boleophthalmus pectinirostris TaxID=150288 RepID=UPI002430C60E|nr:scavenger receptor cysteine-rich type 1 protein M130-like [Boleophthalmus pectinirostris]